MQNNKLPFNEKYGPYALVALRRPNAGQWPQNEPAADCRPLSPAEMTLIGARRYHGDNMEPGDDRLLWRRDHAGGQMSRDQTLYQDHDGTAWHLHAAEENATLHISRLRDDYLDTTGEYWRFFPGDFNEAPAVCRRKGRYYLLSSGCTGWGPNAARSAVADHMTGPWTPLGNPCRGADGPYGGVDLTFGGQGTFLMADNDGSWIYCLDLWRPENAEDGRYAWLPVVWEDGRPVIRWRGQWAGFAAR